MSIAIHLYKALAFPSSSLISSLIPSGSRTSASAPNDSTYFFTSHQPEVFISRIIEPSGWTVTFYFFIEAQMSTIVMALGVLVMEIKKNRESLEESIITLYPLS